MKKAVVVGATELRRKIDEIRKSVPEILDRNRLGEFLLRRMRARFLQETDPDGKRWKPLASSTRKGPQKLIQTGNLYKSIDIVGADRGGFASATRFGFRIGIKSRRYTQTFARGGSRDTDTAVYGPVHQLGNRRVPQRRFIGLGRSDIRSVSELVRRELRRSVQKG